MKYAEMKDLIEEAKFAAAYITDDVDKLLTEKFDNWLYERVIHATTQEEYDRLKLAFEEGYGICMHEQK